MDLRALIFVPALAGAAVFAFVYFTFAAHYYLTILESTGSGAREVTWLRESITDNFWKPFYLAWLLVLWMGPAYVVGRTLAGSTGAAWVGFAVPVLTAWLLYPVSQLSSLSASSVWTPLTLQVFTRLAQKPGVTVAFLVLTLPVFALGGIAFRWAFLTEGEWHLLFTGVPLLAFAGFLYARLLGRLAFVLMFTKDLLKGKKKKKPKPMDATPPTSTNEPAHLPVEVSDPTPIMTPLDGEIVGYNVLIADDPPVPKKRVKAEVIEDDPPELGSAPISPRKPAPATSSRGARTWTDEDDDATPYNVNAPEAVPEECAPKRVFKPKAEDLALLDRRDAPKAPKQVWSAEVVVFFVQPGTISALMTLSLLGALAGAMVRVARQFNPAAGGE
ncbi:hypothetical protein [Frigoriglobus tundricola]|uniref:Uncharacterized protein n=1 Tax=Frigoriglobus tundricola TaxID=2774151 RepID=A0A6M5Z5S8_9BACT|nr:hypothetical protein [Frigoriglobus tundricola]QJX01055.1 hypothetical protein FTUN_8693 [Frigoriglobus tundricola]